MRSDRLLIWTVVVILILLLIPLVGMLGMMTMHGMMGQGMVTQTGGMMMGGMMGWGLGWMIARRRSCARRRSPDSQRDTRINRSYGRRSRALDGVRDVLGDSMALILGFALSAAVIGWIPQQRAARIAEAHLSFNYTTVLNLIFLMVAAVLVWRSAKTGGFEMVRQMNIAPSSNGHHQ
jgi:hypothetical protein